MSSHSGLSEGFGYVGEYFASFLKIYCMYVNTVYYSNLALTQADTSFFVLARSQVLVCRLLWVTVGIFMTHSHGLLRPNLSAIHVQGVNCGLKSCAAPTSVFVTHSSKYCTVLWKYCTHVSMNQQIKMLHLMILQTHSYSRRPLWGGACIHYGWDTGKLTTSMKGCSLMMTAVWGLYYW